MTQKATPFRRHCFPQGSSGLVFSHPLHKPGANSSCEPGQATSSATKRCSCCSVHRKEWAGFCTLPFYGEQNGVLHRSFILFFFRGIIAWLCFWLPFSSLLLLTRIEWDSSTHLPQGLRLPHRHSAQTEHHRCCVSQWELHCARLLRP